MFAGVYLDTSNEARAGFLCPGECNHSRRSPFFRSLLFNLISILLGVHVKGKVKGVGTWALRQFSSPGLGITTKKSRVLDKSRPRWGGSSASVRLRADKVG